MTIVRVERRKDAPWVTVDKTAANDTGLSMQALGVWFYMMSKPPNWTARQSEMRKRFGVGKRHF